MIASILRLLSVLGILLCGVCRVEAKSLLLSEPPTDRRPTSGSTGPSSFHRVIDTRDNIKRGDPALLTNETEQPPITGSSTTTSELATATTPVPLAATIGVIMPNPWQKIYVGLNYTFGFVDAVARPAPTIGGRLRQVRPLLIFPDYKVNVFNSSGTTDPSDPRAIPPGSDGLCGATVEDASVDYPFIFQKSGWYMFVVNQTFTQPTVVNNTCELPILDTQSFFAYQSLSIAPLPTTSPHPASPTSAYTAFAAVGTSLPPSLPVDAQNTSGKQKLAVGLGVAGGILGLIGIFVAVWWVKRKHQREAESLAFSRLSKQDQAAFISENPTSSLNPANSQSPGSRSRTSGVQLPPHGSLAYTSWYWNQVHARSPQASISRGSPAQMMGFPGQSPVFGAQGYQGFQGYPQGFGGTPGGWSGR